MLDFLLAQAYNSFTDQGSDAGALFFEAYLASQVNIICGQSPRVVNPPCYLDRCKALRHGDFGLKQLQ